MNTNFIDLILNTPMLPKEPNLQKIQNIELKAYWADGTECDLEDLESHFSFMSDDYEIKGTMIPFDDEKIAS